MHTFGVHYIHRERGLQIETVKATDADKAQRIVEGKHRKVCIKVTNVWNSDPGFNNPKQRA